MRQQAAIAVGARAAEGQLDRFAEDEGAQLLLRGDFQRPHSGIGAGIDRPRRQRPDQPQLGAVIERHRLAVDDARHRARRAGLQAGARQAARARLGRCLSSPEGKARRRGPPPCSNGCSVSPGMSSTGTHGQVLATATILSVALRNMASNKASARLSPSSEKTTDLALAGRVGNQALVVQAVQRIPIERLPGATILVQAEIEQGQDGVVDPVGVDVVHASPRETRLT